MAILWLSFMPISVVILFGLSVLNNNLKSAYENSLLPMMELGLALDKMHSIREHMLLGAAAENPGEMRIHFNKIVELDSVVDRHILYESSSIMKEDERKAVNDFLEAWISYKKARANAVRYVESTGNHDAMWATLKTGTGQKFNIARNSAIKLMEIQVREIKNEFKTISNLYTSVKVINYIVFILWVLAIIWAVSATIYVIFNIKSDN